MAARRELLRQLAAMDIAERAAQIERNTQHNLAIPSAWLPDEILAMIFKAGMRPQGHSRHFGALVSHVAHRWREVALATTELWTSIRCIVDGGTGWGEAKSERDLYYQGKEYERSVEMARERAAVFLSRTGLAPVDIWVEGIGEFSAEFLQLMSDHMEHCRELHIRNVSHLGGGLLELLKCISSTPTPLMRSIDLEVPFDTDHEGVLPEPLFPFGAPRLATVKLHSLNLRTMHLYLPTGSSVTALRLTNISIGHDHGQGYDSFRDGLMALHSLSHLEIKPRYFGAAPSRLPVVLPALHFLQTDISAGRGIFGQVVGCIEAASLVALSLIMWDGYHEFDDGLIPGGLEFHFPLLQHLDLENVVIDATDLEVLAQRFPHIKRLTCQLDNTSRLKDIGRAIDRILLGPGANKEDEGGDSNGGRRWGNLQSIAVPTQTAFEPSGLQELILKMHAGILQGPDAGKETEGGDSNGGRRWGNLQSIAVSTSQPAFNPSRLQEMILKLQGAGHPIRKLMLPKPSIAQMGAEDTAKLRSIVELEDFSVDWPTPFGCAETELEERTGCTYR
ncbi:hypothetical protein FIBSPDRAFT_948519 [Athelia psychrophila]|uniref:Uncharacterized protein n=1 Tax=Athelia psychrophila TaxID=1759441 RepID=A0A166QVM0_9AGAM|nr:hypothetical protein FIBSPDRAFT_948519 [Fibularhizoctonia sp. CBS 109695]